MSESGWILIPVREHHRGYFKVKHALSNVLAPIVACAELSYNPADAVSVLMQKSVDNAKNKLARYEALLTRETLNIKDVSITNLRSPKLKVLPTSSIKVASDVKATEQYIVDELYANTQTPLVMQASSNITLLNANYVAIVSEPAKLALSREDILNVGIPYATQTLGLGLALVNEYTRLQKGLMYVNEETSQIAVLLPVVH